MTYAIAAAGTGGHVFPALTVAQELAPRGGVVFFGGDRLEATAVPEAGFELVQFRLAGLKRSLSLSNARLPAVVLRAARQMAEELKSRKVKALGAFGGYITVPAAMAARRAKVPLVIHEQNARPGLANRFAASRAVRVLCAFPTAAAALRGGEVIGNPIRREFAGFDRAGLRPEALNRYGLSPQRSVVGVMGGSLGAKALNDATVRFARDRGKDGPAIVHLVGTAHSDALQRKATGSQIPWKVVSFEDSMPHFYAASDVVVCRAGAITVSELAATSTPSVLVPLEAVAQESNAAVLVDAGAARLVAQSDLEGLGRVITELLDEPAALEEMSRLAASVGMPGAAEAVAEALEAAGD